MVLPVCHLCRKDFVGLDELSLHYYQAHHAVHLCRLCSRQYVSAADREKDHKNHISGSLRMTCRFCLFFTNSVKKMEEHYASLGHAQDVKRMACAGCSSLTTSETNLAVHLKYCLANKPTTSGKSTKNKSTSNSTVSNKSSKSVSSPSRRRRSPVDPTDRPRVGREPGATDTGFGGKAIKCPCNNSVSFVSAFRLYEHCIDHHDGSFGFCMFCAMVELGLRSEKEFMDWTRQHRSLHQHNALATTCLFCKKDMGFESISVILKHIEREHPWSKDCLCHICQEYLPDAKFFPRHRCPSQLVDLSSTNIVAGGRRPSSPEISKSPHATSDDRRNSSKKRSRSPPGYSESRRSSEFGKRNRVSSAQPLSPDMSAGSRRSEPKAPSKRKDSPERKKTRLDARDTSDPGSSTDPVLGTTEPDARRTTELDHESLPSPDPTLVIPKEEPLSQEIHTVEDSPSVSPEPNLDTGPLGDSSTNTNFHIHSSTRNSGLLPTPNNVELVGPQRYDHRGHQLPMGHDAPMLSESQRRLGLLPSPTMELSDMELDSGDGESMVPVDPTVFPVRLNAGSSSSPTNDRFLPSGFPNNPQLHPGPRNNGQVGNRFHSLATCRSLAAETQNRGKGNLYTLQRYPPPAATTASTALSNVLGTFGNASVGLERDYREPSFDEGCGEPPTLVPCSTDHPVVPSVPRVGGMQSLMNNYDFPVPQVLRGSGTLSSTDRDIICMNGSVLNLPRATVVAPGMPPFATGAPAAGAGDETRGALTVTFYVCALCKHETSYKGNIKRHVIDKHRVSKELWKGSVRTVERTLADDNEDGANVNATVATATQLKKKQRRKGCQTDAVECPNCAEQAAEIKRLNKVMKRMKKVVKTCFPEGFDS